MKTTILADGTLSITPESELEAYALKQWSEVNLDYTKIPLNGQPLPKMIIDCGEYAKRLGVFVEAPGIPFGQSGLTILEPGVDYPPG